MEDYSTLQLHPEIHNKEKQTEISRDRNQYSIQYQMPILNGKTFWIEKVKYCFMYCKTHYYRAPFDFTHFALDDDNTYITSADIRSK